MLWTDLDRHGCLQHFAFAFVVPFCRLLAAGENVKLGQKLLQTLRSEQTCHMALA